jgi:hypothetical protein
MVDMPARTMLCGKEPVFIFDPQDRSNEAVDDPEGGRNALRFWRIYAQFFRDTFTRAFTTGLRDPHHGRVLEGEWREVLVRLRDSIYYCFNCSSQGTENFYDADAFQASRGKPPQCHKCAKETILPFRIRIGRWILLLNNDTKLYPHHIDDTRTFDFSKPVGEVVRNPQNPKVWGLKNLTAENWWVDLTDGSTKKVEPNRSAPLGNNVKVNFGKLTGEIRY